MTNTGFGFKICKGQNNPQELVKCIKLVGDGVLLGKGDAVKLVTGSINIGPEGVRQAVARAASGDRIYGIVEGFDFLNVASGFTLDRTHSPASTAQYVYVRPIGSNGELYEVQEDGVGNSVATTSVGNNITMIVANASTVTGMSGTMADSSTAATTNTLDLCIRGFGQRADNVPGTNAILVVSFNKIAQVDQASGV